MNNNNSTICSNESSEYEANSDTLDILYKEQLQTLRNIILKHNQAKDIDLCHKWLRVFGKTSKAEKIARNCLCALMQQQLQESGYLSEPFTDMQNCNRDLECVLRELDDQSFVADQNASIATYISHHNSHMQTLKMENRSEPINSTIECMENDTQTENVFLRRELESMRLHLTEKQIENLRLKEIAAKYELESAKCTERCDSLKEIFLKDMDKIMKDLKTDKLFPLCIFTKAFREFSADLEFVSRVNNYDHIFQVILNKKFEKELNARKSLIARHLSQTFRKTKIKLRAKYERRLRVQGWAQRLQLKLVKLKCFSVLRHIFITTQSGNKEALLEVLKVLEEKYQNIINEIL